MAEKKYVRPTRPEARKAGAAWANEGDSGPVEQAFTFSEWAELVGYNIETGLYDLEPHDVHPLPVLTEHNPSRSLHGKQTQAEQSADEGSSDDYRPGRFIPWGPWVGFCD